VAETTLLLGAAHRSCAALVVRTPEGKRSSRLSQCLT